MSALRMMAERIRSAPNPIAKGREVLLEEYAKTSGVQETRVSVSAEFELKRSMVVQAAYESLFGGLTAFSGLWLEVADLPPEIISATEASAASMAGGLASALRKISPRSLETADYILRADIEAKAMGRERYLGSIRRHVPGVGYAVSVRKRYHENQDSFALLDNDGRKTFILGDGCGSAKYASLASHLAVREAAAKSCNGIDSRAICEISRLMKSLLNDEVVRAAAGENGDSGISTLIAGLVESGRTRVFKVGDSIPFISYNDAEIDLLEMLANDFLMRGVIGQGNDLQENEVEVYEREEGRLVLTSDGVTNYLADAAVEIARLTSLSTDPVIVGECLLRSVLRNQIAWNHSDDVTILVQDGT
jgi:serine/threonine protein phosphatase PrpC